MSPNGNLFFIPYSANDIGEFDPTTRTFSNIDISNVISSQRAQLRDDRRCSRVLDGAVVILAKVAGED